MHEVEDDATPCRLPDTCLEASAFLGYTRAMEATAVFAATFAALYAGHHVADYWVQTDHQARHKGAKGPEGVIACLVHVGSYIVTQFVCLILMGLATGQGMLDGWWTVLALTVSGTTHYAADRREYGLMFKLARLLPGKADFMRLGLPRGEERLPTGKPGVFQVIEHDDNPSLGTGTWALDQAWHIALGVFVPALILAAAA